MGDEYFTLAKEHFTVEEEEDFTVGDEYFTLAKEHFSVEEEGDFTVGEEQLQPDLIIFPSCLVPQGRGGCRFYTLPSKGDDGDDIDKYDDVQMMMRVVI